MSQGGRQRPDLPQLGGRLNTASWGHEAQQRVLDREDAARIARVPAPSTSAPVARCMTCHQWGTGASACRQCGAPWEGQPSIGLAPVRMERSR